MKKAIHKLALLASMFSSIGNANIEQTNQQKRKEIAMSKNQRNLTLEELTARNGDGGVWSSPQPIYIPTRSQKIKRKRMLKRMSN